MSSRRRRELATREDQILEVAAAMLTEHGHQGLTMDRLAKATGLSKGTLYQHFSCREEILVALVSQGAERRLGLFERALSWDGSSREQATALLAAQDAFGTAFPHHDAAELAMSASSAIDKAPADLVLRRNQMLARTADLVESLVARAVESGDLVADRASEVWSGLRRLILGGMVEHVRAASNEDPDAPAPLKLRLSAQTYLDGLGWKPRSDEVDYEALFLRVREEQFPDASPEAKAPGDE